MKKYKCKNCEWEGNDNELEYDMLDTCLGDDKIEMCPQCGSYEIVTIQPNSNLVEKNRK